MKGMVSFSVYFFFIFFLSLKPALQFLRVCQHNRVINVIAAFSSFQFFNDIVMIILDMRLIRPSTVQFFVIFLF